jgi:hypothetical protein
VADVRVAAGTAHPAAVALNATATITVGGIVQAAAEVVRAPETTLADLQALAGGCPKPGSPSLTCRFVGDGRPA